MNEWITPYSCNKKVRSKARTERVAGCLIEVPYRLSFHYVSSALQLADFAGEPEAIDLGRLVLASLGCSRGNDVHTHHPEQHWRGEASAQLRGRQGRAGPEPASALPHKDVSAERIVRCHCRARPAAADARAWCAGMTWWGTQPRTTSSPGALRVAGKSLSSIPLVCQLPLPVRC